MHWLSRFFEFEDRQTSLSREVLSGLTTFTTMSYIVVVNPAILSAAGVPAGPSFVATAFIAVIGCYLMGFYANRPFAIAPYMGENAFIAFTVCKLLGFPWQTALGAIFIAGVLFILLTVLRLRQWIVDGVPTSLRYSFAVGIGLFLTFIGLNETGLVTLGVPGAPVQAGHLTSHPALVAIFGFVLLAVLTIRNFPGAILVGIIITAIVAFVTGVAPPPKSLDRFDFSLEWTQGRRGPAPPGADASADPAGPSFTEALRDQLGIKLQATKAPMKVPVLDHVERPSGN